MKCRQSLLVRTIGLGIEYYGKDVAIEDEWMKKKAAKGDVTEIDVVKSCKDWWEKTLTFFWFDSAKKKKKNP